MAIDPRIALGVQPIQQQPNMLAQYAQIMGIKAAQQEAERIRQQAEAEALAVQYQREAERKAAQEAYAARKAAEDAARQADAADIEAQRAAAQALADAAAAQDACSCRLLSRVVMILKPPRSSLLRGT